MTTGELTNGEMTTDAKELFVVMTQSGSVITFAVLASEAFLLLRDKAVMETFAATDTGLSRALKRYFKLVEESGGSHHPMMALAASNGHPHTG